jgi:FSR family fosmidomycin resistance protein-like MFS transporter
MKTNTKALILLSTAHLITDIAQGAVPALLPFFKEALHLSYTSAGVILLVNQLTSSFIQPAFGYLSDRRPMGWFLPFTPFIAGFGIAISGLMNSYFPLLLCIILGGIGISSFHPEAFKTAHFFLGEKKTTGFSFVMVGGNGGIALGPICAIALVTTYGLKGTLGLMIPGIVMSAVLLFSISWLTAPVRSAFLKRKQEPKQPLSKSEFRGLGVLVGVVTIRSWIQAGLVSYIPFYYIDYLKGDPLHAGKLVSTFLLAGAVGSIFGGALADWLGNRRFLLMTMIVLTPLLILFYNGSGLTAYICLAIAGVLLISTITVTTVMGQMLLPQHLGMVSGLMVGFSVGVSGIGVTLLGAVADTWGVPVAMKAVILMPVVGLLVTLPVKDSLKKGPTDSIPAKQG